MQLVRVRICSKKVICYHKVPVYYNMESLKCCQWKYTSAAVAKYGKQTRLIKAKNPQIRANKTKAPKIVPKIREITYGNLKFV